MTRRILIALALSVFLAVPFAPAFAADSATDTAAQVLAPSDDLASTTDSDGDGLTDYQEVHVYHTNPLEADTDRDGYPDGLEVQNGYDPLLPDGVKLKKRIVVSLKTQQLTYYLGPKALNTFLISTGKPGTVTPKGAFAVSNKSVRAWSASAHLWMPWWLGFIGTQYGIHELPEWPNGTKEGVGHLGKPVSHGCIRLGVGPAKTLYDWADIGTPVVVQ